ncbi:MAG: YigZ family protein [Bacteroidales bacterium]|nr:YigZ family protein [Bacteroidales bacterium]
MNDLFKTIESPSKGLYKEKGSKFLAFAFPVAAEDEIKDRISLLRKQYHDARHHCLAWRLGPDIDRYRTNDDGEPSGSAGKPIFGQIQSRDLTNVLVVVVRYFGGTLLGVGGLINAYRSAASDALGRARILEKKVHSLLELEFDYTQMNPVMKVIKDHNLEFYDQQFDMNCTLKLKVWKRIEALVFEKMSKIDGCRIKELE